MRHKRIFRAPTPASGWFDSPPSGNRLIGVRWLTAVLYPDLGKKDHAAIPRDFPSRFHHVDLTTGRLAPRLHDAVAPTP